MYSDDTSIDRLLDDKLISTFTHHKLMALSLMTVGDIRVMGIDKLYGMPGIGLRVKCDLEQVFATIASQDPLLELKQFCSEGVLEKMSICYEHLCENAEDSKDFQEMFPSSIEILKLLLLKEWHLMEIVEDRPKVASYLYVFLFCLECLIHDSFSHFYYYVHENAKHYEQKVGKEVWGGILCSYLSKENRLLLSRIYQVLAKNFRDDELAIPRSTSMEERVGYEVEYFRDSFFEKLDGMFKSQLDFKFVFTSNAHCPFSVLELLIKAYTCKDFEHSDICTLGLFPFLLDRKVSFVADFHKKYGHYPMFSLLVDYLWKDYGKDRSIALDYLGINQDRISSAEVVKRYKVTKARLEKILSNPLLDSEDPFIRDEHWKSYDFLYDMPFMGFFSPVCKDILKKEQLEMDAIGLMEMVLMRNACYPQNKQFRKVKIGNKVMLVNASLFDSAEIAKLAGKVKELLKTERIKDEHYQAGMFLQALDIQKLGGKEYYLAFFTYLLYEVFQIEVDEKGEFVAERNKISVTYELLYILKERGKPMRAEEICKKFQDRCPSYHPLSLSSVRTYLKTIEGVNSLGRTGLYGLEEWENIYWGTMIDKIYEILSNASGPLPLSTIYQEIQEFFPNATKSSVDSSMRLDTRHRFVYDKDTHLYALAEREIVG